MQKDIFDEMKYLLFLGFFFPKVIQKNIKGSNSHVIHRLYFAQYKMIHFYSKQLMNVRYLLISGKRKPYKIFVNLFVTL